MLFSKSNVNNNCAIGGAGAAGLSSSTDGDASDGGVGGKAQGGGIFVGSSNINSELAVAKTQVSTVSGFMDILNSNVSCNLAKGGDGGAGANSTDATGGAGGWGGLAQGGGIFSNFIPADENEPISPTLVAGEFVNVVNSSVCSNTAKGGNGGNGGNGDNGGDGGNGGDAKGGGLLSLTLVAVTNSCVSSNSATGGNGGDGGNSDSSAQRADRAAWEAMPTVAELMPPT